MNYRFGNQQRMLFFGRWPEIMLSEAHEMLLDARRQLAKGIDPLEQAKLEKIAKSLPASNTFQTVGDEWLDNIEEEGAAPMAVKPSRTCARQVAGLVAATYHDSRTSPSRATSNLLRQRGGDARY